MVDFKWTTNAFVSLVHAKRLVRDAQVEGLGNLYASSEDAKRVAKLYPEVIRGIEELIMIVERARNDD